VRSIGAKVTEPITNAEVAAHNPHADATAKRDVDAMMIRIGNKIHMLRNSHAHRNLQDVGIALEPFRGEKRELGISCSLPSFFPLH